MKTRGLKFLLTCASFLVFFLFSGLASATTWDMPTPYPDKTFHTQNISQFAADVEKATGGELKIKIHSAGSLFKHPEIKNAVRGGQVPIGEFFLSLLSNETPYSGQTPSLSWPRTMPMRKNSGPLRNQSSKSCSMLRV